MDRRLRIDIVKRQAPVVLIDNFSGNLLIDYSLEVESLQTSDEVIIWLHYILSEKNTIRVFDAY